MDAVLFAVVMVATLLAAALTVPAGFGLATMLTPIMLLWLAPHLAIAAVAVIHAAHNVHKLFSQYKYFSTHNFSRQEYSSTKYSVSRGISQCKIFSP